ncbi:MAG: DUF2231 domain-containing protein [Candidatus Omnitrophica bacterium]|nr:DUF2231 domain-containing protein [Candidatus Omnitrophota bacterium]
MSWPFPMQSAHPMVVHFPIALLSVAALLDLLALALKRPGIHRVALWNLTLGTLAAACAVLSGLRAESVAKHSFEIEKVMALHERLGITTLILSLMASAWRLAHRDRLSPRARMLTTLVGLLAVGSLAFGAHLGGRLVYEFGVGGSFGLR